jgi:hypothetical protein
VDDIAAAASSDVATWRMPALEAYVGGMSKTSKMPGHSYGLPAAECWSNELQWVIGNGDDPALDVEVLA